MIIVLEFQRLVDPPATKDYFEFSDADVVGFAPDEVDAVFRWPRFVLRERSRNCDCGARMSHW